MSRSPFFVHKLFKVCSSFYCIWPQTTVVRQLLMMNIKLTGSKNDRDLKNNFLFENLMIPSLYIKDKS